MIDIEQRVKKANKDFYNIVGASYEQIDRRRTENLINYITDKLRMISQKTDGDSILDLGCGSGFVSNVARNYFNKRYALDISLKIVSGIIDRTLLKIIADTDSIPIKKEGLSSVVAFALLHHCYSYKKMFYEIYRVLKKGGIFYSDHDLDSFFPRRFGLLLKLYRGIYDSKRRYLSRFSELSKDIYELSEFHQNGIHSKWVESSLRSAGFEKVSVEYHWYGLSPLTDKIFGRRIYGQGNAPLIKIIAIK